MSGPVVIGHLTTRAELCALVARTVDEEITERPLRRACLNPGGHAFAAACGKLACPHCARLAWR